MDKQTIDAYPYIFKETNDWIGIEDRFNNTVIWMPKKKDLNGFVPYLRTLYKDVTGLLNAKCEHESMEETK